MRVLFVHAHFDDFELTAAGTVEMWRRKVGPALRAHVVVCTDGAAGHHFRTREETAQLRLREQQRAAELGGHTFERLTYSDGRVPREGMLRADGPLLAALWKRIRDFRPDYLLCPPLATDPLAGIHPDHQTVAEGVRRVAYLVNVPHAFTPEYPADERHSERCEVPVVLAVSDAYDHGPVRGFDLAVDVEDALPLVAQMAYCHRTQVVEWLPWVGGHDVRSPASLAEWTTAFRERALRHQRRHGLHAERAAELLTVTAWGTVPSFERLTADLPELVPEAATEPLRERLRLWTQR